MRKLLAILVVLLAFAAPAHAADFRQWWPWIFHHCKIAATNQVDISNLDRESLWVLEQDDTGYYLTPGTVFHQIEAGFWRINESWELVITENPQPDSSWTTNTAGELVVRTLWP